MFNIKKFFNKEMGIQIFAQLCFGMIGALLVEGIIAYRTPTIATVNVTGLVDSFVKETVKRPLTSLQKQQNVMMFGQRLNQTVSDLAVKKHLILMLSEAVITGSPDLTEEVAETMKKEMMTQ
jgi:conjugal transfer pilin signal peptidase TrbI